ncbi:hypothetical protein LuPra_03943 [Luteitalea pratensis]|uniref:Uncharacterized protein n=2 Tax=Luteitalea pratensis TaxID=1855912 RepID=A0A143PSC1_LUTPR|nr:hypothetical protein LuPra_03943 [Luteitalea pratensis]
MSVTVVWSPVRPHVLQHAHKGSLMSDPRNVAHAKKVSQEKKHQVADVDGHDARHGQPGKKSAVATPKTDPASASATVGETQDTSADPAAQAPAARRAALEGSLVVLAQLKDLEFHSRAHLERLAAIQMTVEDELKQTDLGGKVADVYAVQSAFQTSLTTLLEAYKAECDRMQGGSA